MTASLALHLLSYKHIQRFQRSKWYGHEVRGMLLQDSNYSDD